MDMMVENTKESTDEMKKLADSISNNPELHKIIAEAYLEREDQDDLSVKPLGLKKDSVKVGKMVITPRVTKPKPKL
jgi:hypothetical protein